MKLALKYVWMLEMLSVFVHLRNESDGISCTMCETVGKCIQQRHCSWTYWRTHTRLDHRPIAAVSIFCLVNHIPARHMLHHTRRNVQHGARLFADSGIHHALASILNWICYSLRLVSNADNPLPPKKGSTILINKHPQSFGKQTHSSAFDVYRKVST